MKPTYKMFPRPTQDDADGGWSYNCDYMIGLSKICRSEERWEVGLEEINETLLAIENYDEEYRLKEHYKSLEEYRKHLVPNSNSRFGMF